ncbi:MAG: ROK family protein [Micropruina sp.]
MDPAPGRLASNTPTPTWIGVDIGAGLIRSALIAFEQGRVVILDSDEWPTMGSTPHHLLARIAQLAYEYSERSRGVAGLGIAFPGAVDAGVTGASAELANQWQGLRVRDMLTGLTALPAVVVSRSDAVVAAPAGLGPAGAAVGAALLAKRSGIGLE